MLECLGYSWDEVHEEAERLEHVVSDAFTERLAVLLGHPEHDPHGDHVLAKDGTLLGQDDSFALSAATAGQRVCIYKVGDEDTSRPAFLRRSEPRNSLTISMVKISRSSSWGLGPR